MRSSPGTPWSPLLFSFVLSVAAPCFSEGTTDFTTKVPTEGTTEMSEENVTVFTNTSELYPDTAPVEVNLLVLETSDDPVKKNVIIGNPAYIELKCNFSTTRDPMSVRVIWKKDDDLINITSNIKIDENVLQTHISFKVTERIHMGNYCCVFEEEKERKGIFNLRVPGIYTKEKPMVNYEQDTVVLNCNSQKYVPVEWIWYASNGSQKVPVDINVKEKYEIVPSPHNETKLKIKHLKSSESGTYWCHATFYLGESEGKQDLKVLSYLVPLKPFLAITAEVVLLVTAIFLYELYTKKKQMPSGKDFEQVEQLKSEDHNGVHKNKNRTRYRKSEVSMD